MAVPHASPATTPAAAHDPTRQVDEQLLGLAEILQDSNLLTWTSETARRMVGVLARAAQAELAEAGRTVGLDDVRARLLLLAEVRARRESWISGGVDADEIIADAWQIRGEDARYQACLAVLDDDLEHALVGLRGPRRSRVVAA